MAAEPIQVQERIRFGDDFELDVTARRRRRGSRTLKLERIPLEILALLLEHGGEIVTRDEIVAKIWGKGVFLDTDNSIRGAIRKIRQVIQDDSEHPRFIQTVTGRGYRFVAPIKIGSQEENGRLRFLGSRRSVGRKFRWILALAKQDSSGHVSGLLQAQWRFLCCLLSPISIS